MKDFSEILSAWETRGGAVPEAKDAEPVEGLPPRSVMERRVTDDELDLHGQTKDAAVVQVRQFLAHARAQGLRKVRLVHGKGLHSEDGRSVLKDAVRQVIAKNPHVATWGEASRQEGGSGATWVWLNARGK